MEFRLSITSTPTSIIMKAAIYLAVGGGRLASFVDFGNVHENAGRASRTRENNGSGMKKEEEEEEEERKILNHKLGVMN